MIRRVFLAVCDECRIERETSEPILDAYGLQRDVYPDKWRHAVVDHEKGTFCGVECMDIWIRRILDARGNV